jgi:RNA polymerase sigma factor (sigma-70 family)
MIRTEIITVDDLKNLMGELRAMARGLLLSEGQPRSLTPTALAVSALRRAKAPDLDWEDVRWENRRHFFGALRMTMGHALIDHARRAKARGRDKLVYLPWNEAVLRNLPEQAEKWPDNLLELHEALAILKERNVDLAEIIELHYFTGFTTQEIAQYLEVDEKTVDRSLKRARLALKRMIENLQNGS